MIAPDETLLEIAQAFEMQADSQQQHLEIHDAETTAPGRE
jgi:hypothetical protein